MSASQGFERYMGHLAGDRHGRHRGYCTWLMPPRRTRAWCRAARVDPPHTSARHQSLHHFVAKAEQSGEELLRPGSQWVVPKMDLSGGAFWILDDAGFPKKGKHSVGVARRYCGILGKQDNWQVAVSLALVTEQASVPVAYRLYLPKQWVQDAERRRNEGVPAGVKFATKTEIALHQLEALMAEGTPKVAQAHRRWRIERDYNEIKQEPRLGHEGRGWRNFNHHATLSIAAYGFLIAERLSAGQSVGTKKSNSSHADSLRFPRITSLAAAQRAQRHVSDSITTIRYQFAFLLIARLGQCPCCGRENVRQFL